MTNEAQSYAKMEITRREQEQTMWGGMTRDQVNPAVTSGKWVKATMCRPDAFATHVAEHGEQARKAYGLPGVRG